MERKVEKGRGDFGWHAMACWAGQVGGIMASRSRSQRSARPPKRRLPKKRVVKGAVAKARAGKRAVAKIAPGIVEAALAAFAHEVRTPLTGILAISDLLATSDLDERERRWVDTIKAGAEHLSSLATLFVDAAKSAATGTAVRQDLFDLRALARSAGDSLAGRAAAKGLRSVVDISEKLPVLVGPVITSDRTRLVDGYACNLNGLSFVRDPTAVINPGDSIVILSADAGG